MELTSKYKIYLKKGIILTILLFGLLFTMTSLVSATSVNRMSLVNLEGHPGKTTKAEIILEGTDPGERTGFWYVHYKKMDGDDERMDITSWISIEPKDFTISQGEKKVFTIKIKVPGKVEPGLWGATSKEAGQEGHSSERRTYLVFKDAPVGGNVYSGLLIPVSIEILPSTNPLAPIINFVKQNIIVIVLSIVIIVMAFFFFKRRKKVN